MSSDPTPESDPLAPGDEPTPCAYTEFVGGPAVEELPATGAGAEGLAADVWEALYAVDDPEMPVSIVDLGLIYGVVVEEDDDADDGRGAGVGEEQDAGVDEGTDPGARVRIAMTLTYTGCPARKYLTEEVEERVREVDGVGSVDLRLVWDPPWSLELVTEEGRERLREFGLSL